jgi:L-alanine-DL-glutamate epimerase-like enolase superfamily enzyme
VRFRRLSFCHSSNNLVSQPAGCKQENGTIMKLTRRYFLGALGASAAVPAGLAVADRPTHPFPDHHELARRIDEPAIIKSIEVLRYRGSLYVRMCSTDGAEGVVAANPDRLNVLMSLFQKRVVPFFLGKDARRIESLVDGVYVASSNYKFAGMPFWACVAHAEMAILDLLARREAKSVGALLGPVLRTKIPVYISRFERETNAQAALDKAAAAVEKAGARAVKLKIGLRMRNSAAQSRRDRRLIELARQRFGDAMQILVDANGSYTVREAMDMGRFLESYGVGFFEEPCPWQEYEDTKQVADALNMTVAGGEQDSSLARWQWMVDHRAVDLVQPDVFYNGGLIRTLRVARIAERAGRLVTPHSPKTGEQAYANLQFCAIAPNLGPFQEYRESPSVVNGYVNVPSGPGMGVEYDRHVWSGAEVVWSSED